MAAKGRGAQYLRQGRWRFSGSRGLDFPEQDEHFPAQTAVGMARRTRSKARCGFAMTHHRKNCINPLGAINQGASLPGHG